MALNFIPRKPKRLIALSLIGLGILFATPPIIPLTAWTELLLNIPVAKFIVDNTFITNKMFALFLTFTLIPLALIYVGAWIFPHETNSILRGLLHKTENAVKSYFNLIKRQPIHLIWLIIGFYLLYVFYTSQVTKI